MNRNNKRTRDGLKNQRKFYDYAARASFCIAFPGLAIGAGEYLQGNKILGNYYGLVSLVGLIGTIRLHLNKKSLEEKIEENEKKE